VQSWTAEQNLSGTVVRKSGDQIRVRTQDQGLMNLDVTDSTAISLDGQKASVDQIQPGEDVRASYQMIDGKAKALTIDVSSNANGQNLQQEQNQNLQQEQNQQQQQQPQQPH
jgi:hypothetical protein